MDDSYDEIVSMAIAVDVANQADLTYQKKDHMLEESLGNNTQRLKIVYQSLHHSSCHPPQQQNQQQSKIQPVTALTHIDQPDTPGISPKRSWNRQQCNPKNRAVAKLGRVHFTRADMIPTGEPVMMGLFLVAKQKAVILFDSGASHTFINRSFVIKNQLPIETIDNNFCI
jgi:hypothetical protein